MQELFALFKEQLQQHFEVRLFEWKSATMKATLVSTTRIMRNGIAVELFVWSRNRIDTVDKLFVHIE